MPVDVHIEPMRRLTSIAVAGLLLALLGQTANASPRNHHDKGAEKTKNLPRHSLLWRDPGDVASLDMIDGIGGSDNAPDPHGTFAFVKEDMDGTNPKFDVKDSRGFRWTVKLGEEAQAEVAATRLIWAAGYFVDEDYYLPQIKVRGLPRLHRGREFVSDGGIVHHVRLERKSHKYKSVGNWSWFDNPFSGTREFNGLRVLMALVNNWDLKTSNNSIYLVDGVQQYLVSDMGATFGKTGNSATRSKSDVKGYEKSKFIEKERTIDVDFTMHSRPLLITSVDIPNYEMRTRIETVTKHIPRADARWLGQILGRLSTEQIEDCFRAAGYSPDVVRGYSDEVQKRINELKSL